MLSLKSSSQPNRAIFTEDDTLVANNSFMKLSPEETKQVEIRIVYSNDDMNKAWIKAKAIASMKEK